ncbi:MAG: branched-chain-amino-acid transaminase [Simkaniaceae bacterium]
MEPFVLFNDQVVEKEKVCISPFDRGVIFGDGVFTTILIENGKPVFFDAHQKRLHEQAKSLHIKAPLIAKEHIYDLIAKNNARFGNYRLKIVIMGGSVDVKGFEKRQAGALFGFLEPYEKKNKPLRVSIYPDPVETPIARFKTLSYLHRFILFDWAKERGVDECLIKNSEGILLEGVFSNFFWTCESNFYYPDPRLPLLHGITIQALQKIAENLGMQAKPVKAGLDQIPQEAHIFLTNSLMGFLPVTEIDNKQFPRNPHLEKVLKENFERYKAKY